MKVLVTGGTGFIGQALVRRLIGEQHSVVALYRTHYPQNISPSQLSWEHCDLFDKRRLSNLLTGVEVVFHLAAFAKPWTRDPSYYFKVNCEASILLQEMAIAAGVKTFLHVSSGGVLGPQMNGGLISEKQEGFQQLFTEYEKSKLQANQGLRENADKIKTVIVSPTRVYGNGPLSKSNIATKMMVDYIKGTWRFVPTDGKSVGSYVWVEDLVKGFITAAEKGRSGENYLLGGTNLDFFEFFQVVEQITGIKRVIFKLPKPLLVGFGKANDFWADGLGLTPAITSPWIKKYSQNWAVDSSKAIKELGYNITPAEQGFKHVIENLNST